MAGGLKDVESLLKSLGFLGLSHKITDIAEKTLSGISEKVVKKADGKMDSRAKLEDEKKKLRRAIFDLAKPRVKKEEEGKVESTDEERKATSEFLLENWRQRQRCENGYLPGDEDRFTVVLTEFKKTFIKDDVGFEDFLVRYVRNGIVESRSEGGAPKRPETFDADIEIDFPDYLSQKVTRGATQIDQAVGQVVGQTKKLLAESGFVANKKSAPFNTGSVALDELLGTIRAILDTGNRWIYWFIFGFVGWFFFTPFIAMIGSKELLLGFGFVICSLGLVGAAFGIQRPIEIGIVAKGLEKLRKGALSIIAIQLALTLVFAALAPMTAMEIIAFTLLFMMLMVSMAAEQKFLQKLATTALVVIILIAGNRVYGATVSDTLNGWLTKPNISTYTYSVPEKRNLIEQSVVLSPGNKVKIRATDRRHYRLVARDMDSYANIVFQDGAQFKIEYGKRENFGTRWGILTAEGS